MLNQTFTDGETVRLMRTSLKELPIPVEGTVFNVTLEYLNGVETPELLVIFPIGSYDKFPLGDEAISNLTGTSKELATKFKGHDYVFVKLKNSFFLEKVERIKSLKEILIDL